MPFRGVFTGFSQLANFRRRLIALGFNLLRIGDTLPPPLVQILKCRHIKRVAAQPETFSDTAQVVAKEAEIVHLICGVPVARLWAIRNRNPRLPVRRSDIVGSGTDQPVVAVLLQMCAVHPEVLLIAKMGVNRSIGIPKE